MNRRDCLKGVSASALAGAMALLQTREAGAQEASAKAARGSAPVKITKLKVIRTAPQRARLLVVKVETSEPGLYGLGCATYNQRSETVVTAVEKYLDPFCRGRNADDIEDIWQNAYTSSYWRNGPVMNCALSGLDMALWDIKGKRAGMPVYQLLGGKSRFAVDCYAHSSGRDVKEVEESVKKNMERGFRHIRIQMGGYGSPHLSSEADFKEAGFGLPVDTQMDSLPYLKATPKMFEHVRNTCGEKVELLHDVHERVAPIEAVRLLQELEQYRPFFIEDPVAPEDNGYFPMLRQKTTVPIAMGELFNSPHEWLPLITGRLIDFIRVHMSQAGGFTPSRKIATLCEWFNVRSAWHGPSDLSPVGHAANGHLDLVIRNFGIQESLTFNDATLEVFSGCPRLEKGYMFVNEAPGWGVDVDEEKAKKYPYPEHPGYWEPVRRRDGTAVRP
jgi:mannonate dehydratase